MFKMFAALNVASMQFVTLDDGVAFLGAPQGTEIPDGDRISWVGQLLGQLFIRQWPDQLLMWCTRSIHWLDNLGQMWMQMAIFEYGRRLSQRHSSAGFQS